MRPLAIVIPILLASALAGTACSDPTGPTERLDEAASSPPLTAAATLHPADAWRRDFTPWRPSFFNPANSYTWSRARSDFNGWRPLFWASGLSLLERRGRIVADGAQGNALRITYPASRFGSAESGAAFPWLLGGRYEELSLQYRVKFEDGFLFTTSGKLPGLCGANDDLGCFRYTGGTKPRGDDGFSARVVWLNADGLLATYVYHADQADNFGDIFVWHHATGDPAHVVRGQWHTIGLRVKLNDPGVPNGEVEAWLDGEPVSLVTHLRFRDGSEPGRRIRINEMYFNTFHGGSSPTDAPAQTQHAFFDEFQLAVPISEATEGVLRSGHRRADP